MQLENCSNLCIFSSSESFRVLCKFFAHGACLKGEHCEFSHDWKAPPNNVGDTASSILNILPIYGYRVRFRWPFVFVVLLLQICTFYQKGVCAYGSRCRYDHVKASRAQPSTPSSSIIENQPLVSESVVLGNTRITSNDVTTAAEFSLSNTPYVLPSIPAWNQESVHHDFLREDDVVQSIITSPSELPICSFAAAGNCPRGEQCPHVHGDLCPSCGRHCLHPFRPEEREEHMMSCENKQKHLEALKRSQEIECSVCLERVLSKPTAAERKFGLLSECDHPFCISCIRNWRSSNPTLGMDVNSTLRACPICRKLSYFVVPSVIWYATSDEKLEIIDTYKAKLK